MGYPCERRKQLQAYTIFETNGYQPGNQRFLRDAIVTSFANTNARSYNCHNLYKQVIMGTKVEQAIYKKTLMGNPLWMIDYENNRPLMYPFSV